MTSALDNGPFLDINPFTAQGNYGWDARVYNGMAGFSGSPGPYANGAFSTAVLGAAVQYGSRSWDRHFGDGGVYEFQVIHTTGFDVGIYSFRVDGLEVASLDGYSLGDANNVRTTLARRVPISPGWHRISIEMNVASPLATGLKFYPALSAFSISRVGAYVHRAGASPRGRRGPRIFGRTVDICPMLAAGNTNWSNVGLTNAMMNAYELYSSGAQNAARWWDGVTLEAGAWDLDLRVATFSSAGIISVQIDGVTVGVIDTYSGSTVYGVQKLLRIMVPTSGRHRLTFLMATKNGSSSNYFGDISQLQLRQVPVPRLPSAVWPGLAYRTMFAATGNLNWDTLFVEATMCYSADIESTGAQNASRWWDVTVGAGTYTFALLHATGGNRGIYTLRIDGVSVGTIDGYGGASKNVVSTITGIVVPRSGAHRVELLMATKNGSSSAYYGTATAWQMMAA